MPTILTPPVSMSNGDKVTAFIDTVGATATTYTFTSAQDQITITNNGTDSITFTLGGVDKVIAQYETYTSTSSFTSFSSKSNTTRTNQINVSAVVKASTGGGAVTAADITDATAVGREVLKATDAAAARTAIGAGTSSLIVGTAANQAKAGNYAPPNATSSVRGLVLQGPTQAPSVANDVAGVVTDLNALLVKLKTAGVLA